MFSGCRKAGLAFAFAVSALMMSGCVSVTSAEQVKANMRDLLDNHKNVNEVREVWSLGNIDPQLNDMSEAATPILAAIVLGDIDRVSKLIGSGASVKYIKGTSISPLECASFMDSCQIALKMKGGVHIVAFLMLMSR